MVSGAPEVSCSLPACLPDQGSPEVFYVRSPLAVNVTVPKRSCHAEVPQMASVLNHSLSMISPPHASPFHE